MRILIGAHLRRQLDTVNRLFVEAAPLSDTVQILNRLIGRLDGGVRACRLLQPGTVTFTIVNASQTRTLTVRIKASTPRTPAPACLAHQKTFVIDAGDGGPEGWPVCMRTTGIVRVVNLGPDGFQVSPAGAVKCSDEAAVRDCRFTGPGTVTFTTTHGDSAPRIQNVVAIR